MNRFAVLAAAFVLASIAPAQVTITPVTPGGISAPSPERVLALQSTPRYPGVITTPGGGLCTPNFTYDGGNESPGTFITQACAQNAGLGTIGAGGNFIPPAGTACQFINGGLSQVFVFPCITVAATDIQGSTCFCKTTVYVVKNGSNYLNIDLLSRDWGRCVRVADYAEEGAVWPRVLSVATPVAMASVGAENAGQVLQTFAATVVGNPLGSTAAATIQTRVRRLGGSSYSFVPASLATQLNLSIVGTRDFSRGEPRMLAFLDVAGLRSNGQQAFPIAYLPSIRFDIGDARGGYVFVIDDANCSDIVVGGYDPYLLRDFVYLIGATAATPDQLVLADRPAAPPVPWTVFGPTAAVSAEGLGDFRLHPTPPPGGFSEGATLLSLDTRGLFGHGPVVGIYPDALTLLPLLHVAAPGNVFRFTDAAGTYPHTDLYLPPGSLPIGTEVDVAMLYLTSSGYQATGPLRVTSH